MKSMIAVLLIVVALCVGASAAAPVPTLLTTPTPPGAMDPPSADMSAYRPGLYAVELAKSAAALGRSAGAGRQVSYYLPGPFAVELGKSAAALAQSGRASRNQRLPGQLVCI